MQISDVVPGLAAGIGLDLSPDEKTVYYVEWSIGELCKIEVATGMVTTVKTGLSYPEDVEVDWQTNEIFVSERTGKVIRIAGGKRAEALVEPGGAPQQLDLKRAGSTRYLYTVCYDSGRLLRIDVGTKAIDTIASGLGHPVGIVVDAMQKYAYVTEQDKRALTRIELSNGATRQLYTGLVAPFFLAWDKDARGIFCVQRDPANSLVRLELGSTVTMTTVATGLAWRPSGVAPNADNSLIYICADRELEVICFDGCTPVKRPKPPFEIYSILFNDDKSAAVRLKDHLSGSPVPLPEYVKNVRSEPAAYVVRTIPHIKVVFRKLPAYTGGACIIGATGSLGGVRRKTVTPVFNSSGLSNPIDFELLWPLPGAIGKPDVSFDWITRDAGGPSVPVPIGATSHRIYLLANRPTEPWITEMPWVAALEIACGWAAGSTNADAAATRIADRYYNSGRVKYDDVSGATAYGLGTYMLSEMIERLNGGPGLGIKVNCTDSADTVSTLSNLLGCDLWQCRMASGFDLNPILAIGFPPPDPWPQWSGFNYHEVAWKGACTENDNVFDGCLMVDGDSDPAKAPHSWLLPTDMLFGNCSSSTMNYRQRLCPPGTDGCDRCQPQPGTTRQRRPIG